jgi:protease-4
LSEGGRKKLREGLQVIYDGFVHRVAEGRRMKDAQVEPLAQGRAWLGSDARKHGLADETGGLDKALELLRQKAKIPAGEKIRLITYPPRRSFFDLVFSRPSESALAAKLRALIADPMARLVLDGSLAHGVMLRMMPFTIRVE